MDNYLNALNLYKDEAPKEKFDKETEKLLKELEVKEEN